jgi:D-sedoheptulose 7-phosphate isomerase
MGFDRESCHSRITAAAAAVRALEGHLDAIVGAGKAVRAAVEGSGTIFVFGNGGSAAQSLHMAEELIGKYRLPRAPIRALCLNADPTALTCIANDFGFAEVFARQVRGLARTGDVVVALSTSGASENIVRGLTAARELGVTTIGLLGRDGGAALALCDHAIVVPARESELIQEAHQVVVHLLVEAAEG